MTEPKLRYLADDKAIREVLRFTSFDNGVTPGREAIIGQLVDYCATLRPAPKVPTLKPVVSIPVLHGDDVFSITGRGTIVALNMNLQPVVKVDVGDLVMFDAETKTAASTPDQQRWTIDHTVVYEVTGIESPGYSAKGLMVKAVARLA